MKETPYTRRTFVQSALGAGALAGGVLGYPAVAGQDIATAGETAATGESSDQTQPAIFKSLKWGMIQPNGDDTVLSRFQAAKSAGFQGVELDSPGGPPVDEVRAAVIKTALVVDGTVDSTHWQTRMSDPDDAVRARAGKDLITALADTAAWGGHSVLLVPGHGKDGTRQQTWDRSGEQIRKALPIAARLGIHILIENVWNHMFYDHEGSADQTADELAQYVDQFKSPWIGVQFDIGNHQKYGNPASWIRTLGQRIVKLDVKDWGTDVGFCKIGDGDVPWPEVRRALADINFTGWAAAEVAGGGPERLREISERMDTALLG